MTSEDRWNFDPDGVNEQRIRTAEQQWWYEKVTPAGGDRDSRYLNEDLYLPVVALTLVGAGICFAIAVAANAPWVAAIGAAANLAALAMVILVVELR